MNADSHKRFTNKKRGIVDNKKLDIIGIKSDRGYYISITNNPYSQMVYLINGQEPVKTFHADWYIIPDVLLKVSRMVKQPNINHKFVLTDDTLTSNKIPLELKREDVGTLDCEGNVIWKSELAMYRSLYIEVSDPQPPAEELEDFTFTELFSVGEIVPPPEFKYPVNAVYVSYSDKLIPQSVTNGAIVHQKLDEILFPDILLPNTPCKLSAKDSFAIIREHVKMNIDKKVAYISSDYAFCFDVKKRIYIKKPYTQTYTETPRGRRKPVTTQKYINDREGVCFEMTAESYKDYTQLTPFEGKNEFELKTQIDNYLKDLMSVINAPLMDCPHCNGTGVVVVGIHD